LYTGIAATVTDVLLSQKQLQLAKFVGSNVQDALDALLPKRHHHPGRG
jgi:hypothetical protein